MRPYQRELPLPERLVHPPLGLLRDLGIIRVELRDLDRLGPPHVEDDPEAFYKAYGLPPSPGREWWLRTSCGLELVLWQDFVSEEVLVGGDEAAELEHLLAHLPFEHELRYVFPLREDGEEAERLSAGGWRVWREDEHGNRFEVVRLSRERSARCYAALLEARAHKQSYGVELQGVQPRPPAQEREPYRWALIRQDDHGRRFLVRRSSNRRWLEFVAEYFNREPRHKQTFLVEPYTPETLT